MVTPFTYFPSYPSCGLLIFTRRWVPAARAPVVVTVVHGFTGESSWAVHLTVVHFAKAGFVVAAVGHQGHGFSEGLHGHIPDIVPVLEDSDGAWGVGEAAQAASERSNRAEGCGRAVARGRWLAADQWSRRRQDGRSSRWRVVRLFAVDERSHIGAGAVRGRGGGVGGG
ncbi:hypothetical protein GUJ93_ZPchr0002g23159 [Zizania palustris]|uniref:Serine aminopeptidase S33 domain-containing protein n=1 Tax=Zizania palustris TaxID=103762 RepID=A0A8J5SNT3_ZIZPA|nr:hypothetical protein GUJ93_ZPchr0002g23159 [Zizania palustris]